MTNTVNKLCACAPDRWPKCPHPWYLKKFRHHQQAYVPNVTRYARVVLGKRITTKTDADDVGDGIIRAILAGTYTPAKGYQPAPASAPITGLSTLRDVVAAYTTRIIEHAEKTPKARQGDIGILEKLCAHADATGQPLGARPIARVTIDDLVSFRHAENGAAASTWAKYRTCLGQLWAWARWSEDVDLDANMLKDSPPSLLKQLSRRKHAQRNRRLSPAEEQHLLTAATDTRYEQSATRLHALIVAALETGCRRGELLALRWRDIDVARENVHIRAEEAGARKSGKARELYLTKALRELLPTLRKDAAGADLPRSAYVFGDEYGERVTNIKKAWESAVLRAHGRPAVWTSKGALAPASRAALAEIDLHFHDLRHEAASRWLESGRFTLEQIRQMLGHANIAQTSTYLNAPTAQVRAAQKAYDRTRHARTRTKRDRSVQKTSKNRPFTGRVEATPRVARRAN